MAFQRDACYLALMNQWLIRRQRNWPIDEFFIRRKIRTIAIYGMGLYGRHLVRDLADTQIIIAYAIDRKRMRSYEGVTIYRLEDEFPPVDAIVYSVLDGTDDIRYWLTTKFECPIYSIEEVIFSYDEYPSH